MKNLSSLKRKLAGYSAMAGAMIAANSHADAQVIYHDIIPDTILQFYSSYYYELDLNNDGLVDYEFSWRQIQGSNGFYGVIDPLNAGVGDNSIILTQYGGPYIAQVNSCEIISAAPIGNNNTWSSYSTVVMLRDSTGSSPWWQNIGIDKYVALKLNLVDGAHYGWIRVVCNPGSDVWDGSLILKDYAYQSIHDSSITTPCANQIKNIDAPDLFNAFVKDHQLILHLSQSIVPSQMFLLNEVGMKLREQTITNSELVMDVSQLAAGIYFVVIDDHEKRQVKKVVIE